MSEQTQTYPVKGMTCAACARSVENMLKMTDGVTDAKVNYASGQVQVNFNQEVTGFAEMQNAVQAIGYDLAESVNLEKEKEEKEKENEKILRKAGEDVKDIKNKPLNHTTVKVAGNVEGHMIINSTLINSLNNNENISADIKEAIEKVAEIVQESQEPLAKNYFDKFMQRIVDKEEPDEIESMWNKIVKTIPAIKDMGDVVTKIATLF